MMQDPEVPNRILAIVGNDGGWDNAPLVVLTVVCVVFCLIWTPMIFRCRCPHVISLHTTSDAENDRESEALRLTLENLRRLESETGINHRRSMTMRRSNPVDHLSPEDRKEFLDNVLVAKKIMSVSTSTEGPSVNDVALDEDLTNKSCHSCHGGTKTTLLLADLADTESTTKLVCVEPCSICLNDYTEGDILCWSQNSKCQHAFHKDCAMEWLMQSTECPLCRNNYLSLDGDDELSTHDENENDGSPILSIPSVLRMINNVPPDDTVTFLRSMHLLYLLSQLQSITGDTPMDTTPHPWQGIEMTTGSFRTGRIVEEQTPAMDVETGSNIAGRLTANNLTPMVEHGLTVNSFDESGSATRVGPTSAMDSDQASDETV